MINSINEMQERQHNRLDEMESLIGPGADEESKTVHSGFPRVGVSVP